MNREGGDPFGMGGAKVFPMPLLSPTLGGVVMSVRDKCELHPRVNKPHLCQDELRRMMKEGTYSRCRTSPLLEQTSTNVQEHKAVDCLLYGVPACLFKWL